MNYLQCPGDRFWIFFPGNLKEIFGNNLNIPSNGGIENKKVIGFGILFLGNLKEIFGDNFFFCFFFFEIIWMRCLALFLMEMNN